MPSLSVSTFVSMLPRVEVRKISVPLRAGTPLGCRAVTVIVELPERPIDLGLAETARTVSLGATGEVAESPHARHAGRAMRAMKRSEVLRVPPVVLDAAGPAPAELGERPS
jgi:hypothetical protein